MNDPAGQAWIRSASDKELSQRVVDPLLIAAQQREAFGVLQQSQRYLAVLWILHTTCCRSGVSSYLAEGPVWLPPLTAEAARYYGLPHIATLFEAATEGMDLEAQHGRIPAQVQWGSRQAADELEQALTWGEFFDFTERACRWIRDRAATFALFPRG